MQPLNYLLVEDDQIDVMKVRRAFQRAGITSSLAVAHDGIEALAMLRNGAVPCRRQVILLDLNMPRMSGLEMLEELRSDPLLRTIPTVVFSTSNEPRDRARAFALGAAGYFVKPLEFSSFATLIEALERYWSRVEFA